MISSIYLKPPPAGGTKQRINWKSILITAFIPIITGWIGWVTWQCYEVATNKEAIIRAGKQIDRNNTILHQRLSQEEQDRERADDRIEDKIFELWGLMIKQLEEGK